MSRILARVVAWLMVREPSPDYAATALANRNAALQYLYLPHTAARPGQS